MSVCVCVCVHVCVCVCVCVHSDEAEVGPHLLKEVVKVPLVVGRDRNCMRNLINYVQLLQENFSKLSEILVV